MSRRDAIVSLAVAPGLIGLAEIGNSYHKERRCSFAIDDIRVLFF